MEAINKQPVNNFLKRFSLHALIVWLLFNIGDWLLYLYNVKLNLAYTVNRDGSLLTETDRFINHNINQPLCLQILLLAFLAEMNFIFVFSKSKLPVFIGSSIGSGLIGGAISLLFTRNRPYYPRTAQFVDSALLIVIYLMGYAIVFNFFQERYRKAKADQKRSESELHLLKAQVNPHFLFNTLNNIYGMALNEHANQTAGAIELLSGMMRYSMDGMKADQISIDSELKFIEDYIGLQRLRIPDKENIQITIVIEHPEHQLKIAPMLLIPLIENAFKYGISVDQPSFIDLGIRFNEDRLEMKLENSVFKDMATEKGSGLGIDNVQQQLWLIYPGSFSFDAGYVHNGYSLRLSITLSI